ncbi:MAG TPA: RNB domain-containing ribonuclease, partial [Sedimenticola sp.]|nr:RNB domain-containing ribonuclease [Sedimenticola sp.]
MTEYRPCQGCLVLYKTRPAIVTEIGEKIDIRLDGGKQKRVRPKDIHLLHPGPVDSLSLAQPVPGDVEEAWELVSGVRTHLQELAGLIYGEYTPETAWATWQLVKEGLWFEGEPDAIVARSREQVEKDRARRQAREQAAREWSGFLERLAARRLEPADRERLQEVERLALGQTGQSRILQALGRQETPAAAHRLLTAVGYWQGEHNPWPARSGMPARNPELAVPELPAEVQRLDLTALPAFAIDDEGNQDPDDAISLDGDRIWVHVADVAALAPPDSSLDLEARARAANLYLPEGVVHMLPPLLTTCLGLGLQARSPALSIGFRVTSDARLEAVEIRSSWVRVSRCSYAEVDRRLDEAPFAHLARLARRFRERRQEQGAVRLDLPEVSVKLAPGGEVLIRPLPRMESREMVMELMLMAGEAVARYAVA